MTRICPCGAKSRGGGGAPPTTLILLRNQRTRTVVATTARARRDPGPVLAFPTAKIRENFLFCCRLLFGGMGGVGCGNRLRRCGRRLRAGPQPPPMPELSEGRGGALPGPVPQTGTLTGAGLCHNLRGAAGDTPRGRAAFGSRKRPPPLRICDIPCAGLPSLALREELFRMATYPPPAQKGRWRVPSQPCSLTAPAVSSMLRMVRAMSMG